MSAIPAGFGAGRHREDAERPAERVSGRGEGGESGVIETSLRRRGWHLFPPRGCQGGGRGENPALSSCLRRRGGHLSRQSPRSPHLSTCPRLVPVPQQHLSRAPLRRRGWHLFGSTCFGGGKR